MQSVGRKTLFHLRVFEKQRMSDSVSVVIPCFNGSAFIAETLESALKQTHPPLEILVVDDGSTDNSAAIAKSFGDPVRVIRQENQGESVARNRGIDEARGDWIALLDADDLWEPDKLKQQISASCNSPDVVCVYTDVYRFDDVGRHEILERPENHSSECYRVEMLSEWSVQPSSALVQTRAAKSVRFPEWTRDSEDMIFFVMLRDEGSFRKISQPLTGYRSSRGQQTRSVDHSCRSIKSRLQWMHEYQNSWTSGEVKAASNRLLSELVEVHDFAYWVRNLKLVRECRDVWKRFFVETHFRHPSFERMLFPRCLLVLKDNVESLIRR